MLRMMVSIRVGFIKFIVVLLLRCWIIKWFLWG